MMKRRLHELLFLTLAVTLIWGVSLATSGPGDPTVSLRLAPGAPTTGALNLDLQSLSFAEAETLVASLTTGDAIDIPFPGGAGVDDLDLTVEVSVDLATRTIEFCGTGSILGLPAVDMLLVAIWPEDVAAEPNLILGIRSSAFALSDLGLTGEFSDLVFGEVAFLLPASSGAGGILSRSALSPIAEAFLIGAFPSAFGTPEIEIDLDGGLQFAGTAPLDSLPERVLEVLAAAPGAEVGFLGSLGLDLGLLRGAPGIDFTDFMLTAYLPELGPIAALDWVSTDPAMPTTLGLAYLDPGWEVTASSTLLADLAGETRTFEIDALLDVNNVGAALHFEGAMTSVWSAPFGATGIDIDTVMLEIDVDSEGNAEGSITGHLSALDPADLTSLMLGAVGASGVNLPSIELPDLDGPTIDDFELTLAGGTAGVGLSASATIGFLGKQATLFFSVTRDFDGNNQMLQGIQLPDTGLADLGFDGPLSEFNFPSTSFVLPRAEIPNVGSIKISSDKLSKKIVDILRDSFPDEQQCTCEPPPGETEAPEFVLDLSPGVNLAATIPVQAVASALPGLRDVLGTSQDAEVLFEGRLGLDLTIFSQTAPSIDLDTLELRLSVAGLAPSLLPPWLERDSSTPTRFHVLYQRPNLSASLESGVRVLLDGEFRTFMLSGAIDLADGGGSIALSGVMSSAWNAPFGINWLDLDTVGIALSAQAGGAFSGELNSMFTLGDGPLAKDLSVAIALEVLPGGGIGGEIWAQADSLGIADLENLLTAVGSPLPIPDLPDVAIQNPQIALGASPAGPSFTVLGEVTVPGLEVTADLLFGLLADDGGGSSRILTGFQLSNFSLGGLVPSLDGTMVGDFELPSLNLVLSGGGTPPTGPSSAVSSDMLSSPARDFFTGVYGTPDFDLSIKTGVNLLAALPDVGPAIGTALDTLGANGGSVLQGSIPTPIPGFGGGGPLEVDLRAELPPMSPSLPNGAQPPWFRQGQVAFFISISAGSFAAGLDGTLDVTIDDTDMAFYVAGEFAGPPIAITLSGGLIAEDPWVSPFGVSFLTVNQLGLNMSFNPVTQSLGLGFIGDGVIVEKDLAVRGDLAISLSTGIPTNFVFDGESTSTFGLSDLVEIQSQMRTAAFPGDPPPAPLDLSQLGDVEIRPVSAEQPIRVKFALRRSPNVEPGFALSGALWASLPGNTIDEIAAVDAAIGIDGVYLFGQVPQDLMIGEFTLADPTVDIDLVPLPPNASLFVSGDVTTPWAMRRIRIDLNSDNAGDLIGEIGAVVDNATELVAAIASDPVGALRTALRPVFAAAGRLEPPWLSPLLAAIDEVEAVVTGVSPQELLEFALTGVTVSSPIGIPPNGLSKVCPVIYPIFENGLCWSIAPSMTDDIGFVQECPITSVESGNRCYLLPVGAPRYSSDRFPETCGLFNRTCCRPFHPEPVRILEGGRCWLTPPSATIEVAKISVCLGVITGETCSGTPTVPLNGAPLACPLATPIDDGGLCYTVPPNVGVDVGGVCTVLNISCSVADLISQDVIPAATQATNEKLDESAPPPPPNAPPIPDAGPVYEVDEGGSVLLTAAASYDPEGAELSVAWDLDGDDFAETPGVEAVFDASSLDGPLLLEVTFEVSDGETVGIGSALVVVSNAAPALSLPPFVWVEPGVSLDQFVAFTDSGLGESWSANVDYGDGAMDALPSVSPDPGVPLLHLYAEDGTYDMQVEVSDSDGSTGLAATRVVVPEPGSALLIGIGALVGFAARRRASGAVRAESRQVVP